MSQHIQNNCPGLLYTPDKYEKNPQYSWRAIAQIKCGAGRVTSAIYKQGHSPGALKNIGLKCSNKINSLPYFIPS